MERESILGKVRWDYLCRRRGASQGQTSARRHPFERDNGARLRGRETYPASAISGAPASGDCNFTSSKQDPVVYALAKHPQ